MNSTIRLVLGLTSLCIFPAGCSNTPPTQDEGLGSVDVALQTTGPDGATYRITDQTVFWVNNADYSFEDRLRIEGPETTQTFSLPPDAYVANVTSMRPDGSFELERNDGTQTELVSARYIGVNPTPFNITANSTTALTLPFRVADIGEVTFDVGRLNVDIDVGVENRSPTSGQMTIQGAVFDEQTFAGELESVSAYVLPPDASITESWAWRITGPFALRSVERACAPVEITSAQSSEVTWNDLTSVVPGSVGELCVRNDSFNDNVSLSVRTVIDPSGTGLGDYLSGSSYEVHSYFTANVPDGVFDGTTLHLDRLVDVNSTGDTYAYYWLVGNGSTQAHFVTRGPGHLQSGVN